MIDKVIVRKEYSDQESMAKLICDFGPWLIVENHHIQNRHLKTPLHLVHSIITAEISTTHNPPSESISDNTNPNENWVGEKSAQKNPMAHDIHVSTQNLCPTLSTCEKRIDLDLISTKSPNYLSQSPQFAETLNAKISHIPFVGTSEIQSSQPTPYFCTLGDDKHKRALSSETVEFLSLGNINSLQDELITNFKIPLSLGLTPNPWSKLSKLEIDFKPKPILKVSFPPMLIKQIEAHTLNKKRGSNFEFSNSP